MVAACLQNHALPTLPREQEKEEGQTSYEDGTLSW
jgi:hypothetical protein